MKPADLPARSLLRAADRHTYILVVEALLIYVPCCAQQTGMHILVVEALPVAIFLSEGRANAYRHKKTLSVEYLSRTI
jgi:hypothetical protein